jgi:ribulose-phosphate 3-epimerase
MLVEDNMRNFYEAKAASLQPSNPALRPSCRVRILRRRFLTQFQVQTNLIELAPSILSADFARLGEQVRAAAEGGGTVIHVDVMDGHFVPNLTLGPPLVKSLRKVTKLPLDCHMMVENPDDFIAAFAEAGADWISVHQEACRHLNRTLHLIKSHNCLAGVVINPATTVDSLAEVLDIVDYVLVMSVNPGFGGQQFIPGTLHKMRRLAEIRSQRGLNYRIEVDGGVALDTIADVVRAGAEILVAGNAVFGKGDPTRNAETLLKAATEAALQKV